MVVGRAYAFGEMYMFMRAAEIVAIVVQMMIIIAI